MTNNEEKIKERIAELQNEIDILKSNELYERIIDFMEEHKFDINVEPYWMGDVDDYNFYFFGLFAETNQIVEATIDSYFFKELETVSWQYLLNYYKETRKK